MAGTAMKRFSAWAAATLILLTAMPAAGGDKDIEHAGDGVRVALPVLAGGISLLRGDEDGLVQFAKSFAVSSALTFGIKKATNVKRPDGTGNDAFPSGHTANAFSAAAYLDHRYGWKYGLPAYMAAGFVGYSRIEADEHDLKDVAAGALLSWTVSHLFVTPMPISASGEVGPDRALLRVSAQW